MKYLVSLPQNTVFHFLNLSGRSEESWFCTSDPEGNKVGSGGGTAWLLSESWKKSGLQVHFERWITSDKRILIHGGGRSRRLPSYAPQGKLLLPVPVFRWARGQKLNQTLLDLQLPLLEKILDDSPSSSHTLLASGDALVLSGSSLPKLSQCDITLFGLSVDPSLASRHGVFICHRNNPEKLLFMLQKPSVKTLRDLAVENLFYIDLGIWLLSDRAVKVLMHKCGWNGTESRYKKGTPEQYDLYGTFGSSLGETPSLSDPDIASLSAAVIDLPGGEFYHFGSSPELVSSSLALQNKISNQRAIVSRNVKPHPAMFVQNSLVDIPLSSTHANLWIENSHVASRWKLAGNQIITGVPGNNWNLNLPRGICLDSAPLPDGRYVIRPYGIDNPFRGEVGSNKTRFMDTIFSNWLSARKLTLSECALHPEEDIQAASIFPIAESIDDAERLIRWMVEGYGDEKSLYLEAERISANEIPEVVDLPALEHQRKEFRRQNWPQLRKNYKRSVFFQLDLNHAAREFVSLSVETPDPLGRYEDPLLVMHDSMFRSRINKYSGKPWKAEYDAAFKTLQKSILAPVAADKVTPAGNVFEDQIVWARSPVRIDLAGGWTDTPPYSIVNGGKVVTISLELNGQAPLQVFLRPSQERVITLRSIDLGKREVISTFEELSAYNQIGSPFSIPKAALCLAGFHPSFSSVTYPDLLSQLQEFGSGIELSFLAAIPKGSGMGTSSNLASAILGGLSDFCGLGWDSFEICSRTLALEQLLTSGGGWQDQYGGIIPGVKLLETEAGWNQIPVIRYLPERLFTDPRYQSSMILYYTGLTRVAKNLLAEIVEGMFLNEHGKLSILKEIKQHAVETWEVIQRGDFNAFGEAIARTWELNKLLDPDTTTPEIESIIRKIDDLSLGYKLPGAGGGGYLYIIAKDPEAAGRIKQRLSNDPPNAKARFVEMKLSAKGLEVSRS